MNAKKYFEIVEDGIRELAIDTFGGFSFEVVQDSRKFFDIIMEDIERWSEQMQSGELTKEDVEWLLKAKKDLFEMQVLKQKGIAQIKIDEFKEKALHLMVDTAFKMVI